MPFPIAGVAAGFAWTGLMIALRGWWAWVVRHAPQVIAQILAGLGLYLFVAEPIADTAMGWIIQRFNGVPGTVGETLYYLNVDDYLTMIFSAYSVRKVGEVTMRARMEPQAP